jgi:hypothetical protein
MKRSALVICLGILSATAVSAQNPPTQSGPNNNAVNSPGQNNSNAPVAGRNSFTEGQAKSKIEEAGYSNVTELKKDDNGVWRGKASKGGSATSISVDFQGNVNAANGRIKDDGYNFHVFSTTTPTRREWWDDWRPPVCRIRTSASWPTTPIAGSMARTIATGMALTIAPKAPAKGAGIGAGVGGTADLLAGLGLLALPGLGPVVELAGWPRRRWERQLELRPEALSVPSRKQAFRMKMPFLRGRRPSRRHSRFSARTRRGPVPSRCDLERIFRQPSGTKGRLAKGWLEVVRPIKQTLWS